MARQYYTLCVWDERVSAWFDNFGSYSKAEVLAEKRLAREEGVPAKYLAVISTGELAQDMIAARDALPHPKG